VTIDDQRKRELRKLKRVPGCTECGKRPSAADLLDPTEYWDALAKTGRRLAVAEGEEAILVRVGDKRFGRSTFTKGRVDTALLERALPLTGITLPGGTLVDVGAGVGGLAVASVRRGLFAKAIAIEPDPDNFRLLKANAVLNDVDESITCVDRALAPDATTPLGLATSRKNPGDSKTILATSEATPDVALAVSTLDAVAPGLSKATDLVVLDVAGFEGAVLAGAKSTIASGVAVLLRFWPREIERYGEAESIHALVAHHGGWYDLSSPTPERQSAGYLKDLYRSAIEAGSASSIEVLVTSD
jgi:FkbM family methyltransferase